MSRWSDGAEPEPDVYDKLCAYMGLGGPHDGLDKLGYLILLGRRIAFENPGGPIVLEDDDE
jgi:hypothetical protein